MSVYIKTETHYFAKCDWCERVVDITGNKPGIDHDIEFQRELPVGWARDWDAIKTHKHGLSNDHPPIYCSEIHMDRARQVAALKALP